MGNMGFFASDNTAPVHEDVMAAILDENKGHAASYGFDKTTEKCAKLFKAHFGSNSEVFFVNTGTAANVFSLSSICQPHESIICTDCAHINVDECGAIARFSGISLNTVPHKSGKISACDIEAMLSNKGNVHRIQPAVVSISQATELGTVYSVEELRELSDCAHSHGLFVHCDGARLANAAVSLKSGLGDITTGAGIDIVSFGGTKNGLLNAEAIITINKKVVQTLPFIRKQGMQLCAKMRFVAAQFMVYFTNDLWYKNAKNANDMVRLLTGWLEKIPGINIAYPVQSNAVFLQMPSGWIDKLLENNYFYVWNSAESMIRIMTSYNTTEKEIISFVRDVEACL